MSILCFGEILLRQQALGDRFFEPNHNLLRIYPGGSEANVAATLAQLGNTVSYFSAFPNHALSEEILSSLHSLRIDTSKVARTGDRIGSYILLSANGLTKGEVIYDRKYSAFSQLELDDIDVNTLLDGIDWLHWTALTPALNEQMSLLMLETLREAHQRGITISVDLNYRSKLWQYGKEPIEVMPELVHYCDVVMGNIWAANKMLGTSIDDKFDRHTAADDYIAYSAQTAQEIFTKFPKVKHVANTFRFMDTPQHNLFYGAYHSTTENTVSRIYETHEVIDRIGSGDAFMGGLIHAIREKKSAQQIADIATGAGYHKLFVAGDFGNGKY